VPTPKTCHGTRSCNTGPMCHRPQTSALRVGCVCPRPRRSGPMCHGPGSPQRWEWGACAPGPIFPARAATCGAAMRLACRAGGRTVRWTSGKPAALNRPRRTGPGATPQAPPAPQSSAASAVRPQAAAATTPMPQRCCPDHTVATSLLLRSHEMARSPGTARLSTSLSPQWSADGRDEPWQRVGRVPSTGVRVTLAPIRAARPGAGAGLFRSRCATGGRSVGWRGGLTEAGTTLRSV
jgi:hypothetical protein